MYWSGFLVALDFYSLVMISKSLSEFQCPGLDVFGLVWVSKCCGTKQTKQKAYSGKCSKFYVVFNNKGDLFTK